MAPLLGDGAVDRVITPVELEEHVRRIAQDVRGRRVLLVPPDHTRLHSRSGEIAGCLYETLTAAGCDVGVLPALGTHAAMSEAEVQLLFGDRIPFERILVHRWRDGVVQLGELAGAEIEALSRGRYSDPIPVEVDEQLLDGWDLVVSIGQVVPHEVVGTAGFTKNVVIGLGGAATIHRSHFLGAVCGMETLMGRAQTPVRDAIDSAFDRHLAGSVDVLWILTVTEDTPGGVVQRGLFTGRGGSGDSGGAAYRAAAELAAGCNIVTVPEPLERSRLPARPGGVPHDLAREQGDLPHAHGDRRRRRADRARTRRRALRRGPGDRRADPPSRLPRHSGDARSGQRRPGARRQPRRRGPPHPRQQ